ncbi:DUF2254 family protein [Kitasatospora paranensis]|uniref:DUF2254 family protein n=1 Tax=Kitasatospora paranensis TaxID=258053 RepID=UPI003CD05CC3
MPHRGAGDRYRGHGHPRGARRDRRPGARPAGPAAHPPAAGVHLLQLAPVLHSVTERGRGLLDSLHARRSAGADRLTAPPGPPGASGPPPTTVSWPHPVAVLQQVDTERLLAAARRADAVVVLRAVPGDTLPYGATVAQVHGARLDAAQVLAALVTGTDRTFDQDPLLAFRLLADIVLRALSPAVNDPATAVQGLDCLEDLLRAPAALSAGPLGIPDRDGTVRIVVQLPAWEDFLRTGVDDVIAAAGNAPMVLIRLRTMLLGLHGQGEPDRHGLVGRRLAWVERRLTDRYPVLWDELDRPAAD